MRDCEDRSSFGHSLPGFAQGSVLQVLDWTDRLGMTCDLPLPEIYLRMEAQGRIKLSHDQINLGLR